MKRLVFPKILLGVSLCLTVILTRGLHWNPVLSGVVAALGAVVVESLMESLARAQSSGKSNPPMGDDEIANSGPRGTR